MENTQPTGGDQTNIKKPQPPQPPRAKARRARVYIIAVVLIGGALLIANLATEEATIEETQTDVSVTEPAEEVVVIIDEETGKEAPVDVSGFVSSVSLDAFSDLDEATTIVNSAQGKPVAGEGAEQIVHGVVDSAENDRVYFATMETRADTGETFVGIYHYHTKTNRWQRVYKTTFEPLEDGTTSMLRVLGRADDTLILWKDIVERSSSPCQQPLLLADESGSLMAMKLSDPYGNLASFPLPDTIRQEAEEAQATCESK